MRADAFRPYLGQVVVVDTRARTVCIGRLHAMDAHAAVLRDVDVHDCRDSKTAKDLYLIEAKRHGVQVNRREARLPLGEVVAMSPLQDILDRWPAEPDSTASP